MLSKEDYIRKHYLGGKDASNGADTKRKEKKRRKREVVPRMKIIDDSESGWSKRDLEEVKDDDEDPYLKDDLPTVAEIVDERPEEEVILEKYRRSDRWKSFDYSNNEKVSPKDTSLKKKRPNSSDASPPRKQRHDSTDASPPRKRHDSSDASPPRKQRHDSSDASPPRKQRHDSSDASSPRKRHDSSDASPPRKQRRHDSSDASPPRKQRHNSSDASPPRKRHDSSDASPPRKQRHDSSDASPPRKQRHISSDASPPRKQRHDSSDASHSPKPLESKECKNRNVTVYRDRETGKKKEINKDLEMKQNLISAKVERFKRGILQQQKKENFAAEALHEMGKSFTRSKGDADLEEHLKNQEHEEDPMAQFLRKKKRKGKVEVEKPKYKGAWPANRFNIPPGYRWDGVDRSNGFEKKYFSSINERKAIAEIAHKWSVEDM